ncbi:MAG TPA: hypothetical protein VK783_08265 [Bacteroidia bacterium]|jgi:hypothetical protein|nr:hypothetical protein [Bacteroidia bacterium]
MKKIILTAALAITTFGVFAQGSDQLVSKKGEMYLPEAGDWAISFSATPFLDYFGAFLSNNGAQAPTASFLNGNQTIIGKYYVDAQTAYRGLLRIGINSQGLDNLVNDDASTAVPNPMTTDHWTASQHYIGLGVGMEKRRGKTRLQGYYGAEFMFALSGSDNTYTYGNAFTSSDQTPTSTPGTTFIGANNGTPGSRTLTNDAGSTFAISLQGFIGFEYFFMPKISVGGEYTWGINFTSTSQGTMTQENGNGSTSTTVTTHTGASSSFSLDSGINNPWGAPAGNLYINFHF